jgi:hypothetical protein
MRWVGEAARGKKKGLMGDVHMVVTGERKCVTTGVPKLEGKASFGEYAKALQAEWVERGGGDLRGKAG